MPLPIYVPVWAAFCIGIFALGEIQDNTKKRPQWPIYWSSLVYANAGSIWVMLWYDVMK